MGLTPQENEQLRVSLQDAVVKCSERCLYQSAKWAAELLNAIPEPPADANLDQPPPRPEVDPAEESLEKAELNKYLLAKSLFDCREFDRCAAVFLPESVMVSIMSGPADEHNTSSKSHARTHIPAAGDRLAGAHELPQLSQKSLFLALYAKVLSGEKKKDEDSEMVMGPHDLGTTTNKQLRIVGAYLHQWFSQRECDDNDDFIGSHGWLEYLYGMVLAKEKNEQQAMAWFIKSVNRFPMNWGCWLEMTSITSRVEDLNRIAGELPHNIVTLIFHLHTSLELYQQGPNLAHSLNQLLDIFPTSPFLLTCNALLSYHSKDLETAEQHFSQLLSLHPHRLDSLDHYSNILYVLNQRPKLAFLAHLCSGVDRFRPESCVVVGNYYSLLSQHEKAVAYFRRALTLDRSCLSAWTLMGHEYVELKNTHAAIESYRRAVDVNRRDYRAWYGLGQTYEVLEMHTYALWYYKKAAGLRPWDGKMWMAVGSCLDKMDRPQDGIKALKRALLAESYYDSTSSSFGSSVDRASGHLDPEIVLQIASMYEKLGLEDEAKGYMELCVAQEEGEAANLGESVAIHHDSPDSDDDEGAGPGNEGTGVTPATSKARMWLARHAMADGNFKLAARLASELCHDGVEVEEAKALMRAARGQLESGSAQAG